MSASSNIPITIELDPQVVQNAKELATIHPLSDDRKQVFLDTLAIHAVSIYLNRLKIEIDLELSEGLHPITQMFHGAATLYLPKYGHLECIPVLPNEQSLQASSGQNYCIGSVVVQFETSLAQVQLVGFIPPVFPLNEEPFQEISLDELQPLENIFDYLWKLEEGVSIFEDALAQPQDDSVADGIREVLKARQPVEVITLLEQICRASLVNVDAFKQKEQLSYSFFMDQTENVDEHDPLVLESDTEKRLKQFLIVLMNQLEQAWSVELEETCSPVVSLSNWFQGSIKSPWRPPTDKMGFRREVRTPTSTDGKIIQRELLINRSMFNPGFAVLLLTRFELLDQRVTADIGLRAIDSRDVLPENIKLRLLAESQLSQEVTARQSDHRIQLKPFNSNCGDEITVEVTLGETSVTQDFVI